MPKTINSLSLTYSCIKRTRASWYVHVYRKLTFTGLYTRFDSFSARKQKVSLINCLIDRTYKISSEKFLQSDLEKLKFIFLSNGYLERILDRAFNQSKKDKPIGPTKCPIYLKLPWIGQISETFWQLIKLITEQTFFVDRFVGIFSTKTILPHTHKESLPASSSNCVVYKFKCKCGSHYVGRN